MSSLKGSSSSKNQKLKNEDSNTDNFGKDLTKLAEQNKLDSVIGREKEIERVVKYLQEERK